jgi:broad specificity phosphatase PhoE
MSQVLLVRHGQASGLYDVLSDLGERQSQMLGGRSRGRVPDWWGRDAAAPADRRAGRRRRGWAADVVDDG